MKKIIRLFIALVVTVIIATGIKLSPRIFAAQSVEQLSDNLYTMQYKGDYGFDDFLRNGGATSSEELKGYITEFLSFGFYKAPSSQESSLKYGCSTISAYNNEGESLFGRNFDWTDSCKVMIVRTNGKNAYKSISTVNLNFLGFDPDWEPKGLLNAMMSLASIYVPLDGINEKGLVIADLNAGDDETTNQIGNKVSITTTTGIRLILDKAASVDEAIELLKQYNMNSDISTSHHYAIADITGKSVVVEYVDNQLYVKETPVVANHYLTSTRKCGLGSDNSFYRQSLLEEALQKYSFVLGKDEMLEAINKASNHNTRWQVFFDQTNLSYSLYLSTDHKKEYSFSL